MFLRFRRFDFPELMKMLSQGLKKIKQKSTNKKCALFKINICTEKTGYSHGQGEQV